MPQGKARVGFLGAGGWATANHLPLLARRDDVELTAVCRLGCEELHQLQERFGFPFVTESAHELVNYPGLDAVFVCSPPSLHYEHTRLALERGLHVLCETPLCTRAEYARELVRLAKDRGLHLLVSHGWHYQPFVQQARHWLNEGALGYIQYVLCHMASTVGDLLRGDRLEREQSSGQVADALFAPDPRTWSDPALAGGGYGHVQLSHATSLLFWLTGLMPESVFALMTAPGARVDLYDAFSVRFTGNTTGTISGAGTVPPSRRAKYQLDLRLFGSEGMLLLDCERARLELCRHDGRTERLELDLDAGAYSCEGPPQNFIDLVLGKTTRNDSPGEAALRSVLLLDAAYRSAASGQVERVR